MIQTFSISRVTYHRVQAYGMPSFWEILQWSVDPLKNSKHTSISMFDFTINISKKNFPFPFSIPKLLNKVQTVTLTPVSVFAVTGDRKNDNIKKKNKVQKHIPAEYVALFQITVHLLQINDRLRLQRKQQHEFISIIYFEPPPCCVLEQDTLLPESTG